MRNLSVYQRFAMIIAALTIVLFAVSALQILVLRDATLDERRTTVRDLVEAATKVLAHYEGEAKAGRIEPDKARQMAFAAISSMRWGEHSDYIGVYGTGSCRRRRHLRARQSQIHQRQPLGLQGQERQAADPGHRADRARRRRLCRISGTPVGRWRRTSQGLLCRDLWRGRQASGASGRRLCRRYRRRGVSPDDLGRDRRAGRAGDRGIRCVLAWPRPGRVR